MMINDDVDDV